MLIQSTNKLVQNTSDLPLPKSIDKLYLDVETTTGEDDGLASFNPWMKCKILGIGITWDDNPNKYYIPVRHRGAQRLLNLNVDQVHAWLKYIFSVTDTWINHNIKYDVHVVENELNINLDHIRKIDTLVESKLVPMEEKFIYDLAVVARDFLFRDIKHFEDAIKVYVLNKDYAYIPIDIMESYACCDVETVRDLHTYCLKNIPEDCTYIRKLENQVTEVLVDIERRGMRIDVLGLQKNFIAYTEFLPKLQEMIAKVTGHKDIRPHVNGDLAEYFIHQRGYPVYEWTEGGKDGTKKKPSFNYEALLAYKVHEPDLIKMIMYYRDLDKLVSGFIVPLLEHNVNGMVHGNYDQSKRTGRMSIREPALQTLPRSAREFILVNDLGSSILNFDFSQIEFRTIVHYIEDAKAIAAYNNDPKTDFHEWMANLCQVERDAAKTLNFLLGYGGGKARCCQELKGLEVIVARSIREGLDMDTLASNTYDIYHKMLPTLSTNSYNAKEIMRMRGYVKTFFGRRRYLPIKAARKAFNSACQGSAADLMKQRTIELYERLKGTGSYINGIVHDSWSIIAPDDELAPDIIKILQQRPKGFSVPIVADFTKSSRNWRDCFENQCTKCGSWGKLGKGCKVC